MTPDSQEEHSMKKENKPMLNWNILDSWKAREASSDERRKKPQHGQFNDDSIYKI